MANNDNIEVSYYAIIPANVRYDSRITPNAKLLYGEITALCNQDGICWATNDYFSKLYGVSKTSISKWISSLVNCGYIENVIAYKEGTKEIKNRHLKLSTPIEEKLNTPIEEKLNTPIEEKLNTPIEEKLKENNTSYLNNTDIYINNIKDIVEFLNKTAKKNYKPNTKSTIKVIKARLVEGYSVDDFKSVIKKKTIDWIDDPKMNDYLRPTTLFGEKFEGYLNQKEKKGENSSDRRVEESITGDIERDRELEEYIHSEEFLNDDGNLF